MATKRQHSKLQVLETRSTGLTNRSKDSRWKCRSLLCECTTMKVINVADTKEGRLMALDIKNAGNVTRNGE